VSPKYKYKKKSMSTNIETSLNPGINTEAQHPSVADNQLPTLGFVVGKLTDNWGKWPLGRQLKIWADMSGEQAPDSPKFERTYKIIEAAKIAGVTAMTMQRAMKDGRLKFVAPNGRRKILESDLFEYINSDRYTPRKERTKKTAIPTQEGTPEVVCQ
jgi:excisionase family DNA binding protein